MDRWRCHQQESRRNLRGRFLDAQQAGGEERIPAAVQNGRESFHRMPWWNGGEIEIGRGKEIAGRRDVQRDGVGLGSDGDFHGTAGHGSAASGVRLAGHGGSMAAGEMRAAGHVGHDGDQVWRGLRG